jgi:hypothetical protein
MRGPWGLAVAFVAVGCGGSPSRAVEPAPAQTAARPFFTPDEHLHWHIEAAPESATSNRIPRPTDADRVGFAKVARLCHGFVRDALKLCPKSPLDRHVACLSVCVEATEEALTDASRPAPTVTGAVALAPSSTPAAPPPRLPDSFEKVLRACIRQVVESGGEAPAVCRFERPLDEMDFGQRHCNERCARATGSSPADTR